MFQLASVTISTH